MEDCLAMTLNQTQSPSSSGANPAYPHAVLSGLTGELSAGSDLEQLLERFLVSITALAGAQAGAVRVLTDDGRSMRLVGQIGLPSLAGR